MNYLYFISDNKYYFLLMLRFPIDHLHCGAIFLSPRPFSMTVTLPSSS